MFTDWIFEGESDRICLNDCDRGLALIDQKPIVAILWSIDLVNAEIGQQISRPEDDSFLDCGDTNDGGF